MRGGMGSIFASEHGASGHLLHNNGEPLYPHMGYEFQNGRSLHQSVTVVWQLRDVGPGDGGFACVPGSHHANFKLPTRVAACEEDLGLVKQLEFEAGDVLFFADGALAHGTLPWRSRVPRRAMLAKYQSRSFHRGDEPLLPLRPPPRPAWWILVLGVWIDRRSLRYRDWDFPLTVLQSQDSRSINTYQI